MLAYGNSRRANRRRNREYLSISFDASELRAKDIKAVIISSVVPDIMYSLTQGIRKYFHIEPMIVSVGMKTGIAIIDDPKVWGQTALSI